MHYNLSSEDIEYIVTAYCLGKLTRVELAHKYGVEPYIIRNVCNNHVEEYLPKIFTKEQLQELRDLTRGQLAKKYNMTQLLVKFLKYRIEGRISNNIIGVKMRCHKCLGMYMRMPDIIKCPHCGTSIHDTAATKKSYRRTIVGP